MKIEEIQLPEIKEAEIFPEIKREEIEERYMKISQKMREKRLSHIIIYSDREHYANLSYLTGGYDSRFEESLLILAKDEIPVLVVGNEGYSYSDISILEHKKELFQTFSLQGQVRDKKNRLSEIFKRYGLNSKSVVGVVGIKYYERNEVKNPKHTFDIPHYIIKELTELTPFNQIENATALMTHPIEGVRCNITHNEIARFEFMGSYISNQMKKVIKGLKIGMTESDAVSDFDYRGIPFTVHPVVNFGTSRVHLGLASPLLNKILQKGEAVSLSLVVEGASIARAGFAVSSEKEFDADKNDIISEFYFPYYNALKAWYEGIRIGNQTKNVYDEVMGILGNKKFGVTLNPGHQIHMEEWINSPFRKDVNFTLHTGMSFQADIIAFPGEPYVGVHVEDTVIIADGNLRKNLSDNYPDAWERITIRKDMMKNLLGIDIGEEVLPMSNLQAVFFPFFLDTRFLITAKK